MGITFGDHLIDSGYYDIMPEQEREAEDARYATSVSSLPSIPAHIGKDVRVLTKRFGNLLGPEFLVACGTRYFKVGALGLSQLRRGISPDELMLLEVDPDEPGEEY